MAPLLKVPHGKDELFAMFGNPWDASFVKNNIVVYKMPFAIKDSYSNGKVTKFHTHKLLVPTLDALFKAVTPSDLHDFGGCYVMRGVRGNDSKLSTHAFGIALDCNVPENPLGATVMKQPPALVAVFKSLGFMWGGDFKLRKDGMHFQFVTGY